MRTKLMVAAISAVALGGVALEALAQAKPDVLVKQRQAAMTLQGKYLGPIGAMMKGAAPYNADVVALNATFLENLSRMPWDGFDPSTKGEKSRALPAIWEQPGKVKEAIDRLQSEVGKLQQVSKGGDEGAIKAQIGAVGKACANCHDNFREKQ